MKFFIISALVAAVSAEAQFLGGYSGLRGVYPYSGLAGGYPYTAAFGGYPYSAGLGDNVAGVPFGSSSGLDALTQGVDPVTQGYSYAPYTSGYGKREADAEAEADAQYLYGGYHGYAAAPVATAVAHSVQTTVKHACRTVVTEHCVDNPIVKAVPVEVEHCHTVTKVACEPVDNEIPTTQCEAVTTEHLSHAAVAAPVAAAYYGRK
jgi:hypothetical protein